MKKSLFNENSEGTRAATILAGAIIAAIALNVFVSPVGIYAGGFTGISQLLNLFLTDGLGLDFGGFNMYSVIYYVINVPALVIMLKTMGGRYTVKTIYAVTAVTVFMAFVPRITPAIMGDDILASAIIGGVLMGVGCGLILRSGASDGGMDVIGVLLVNRYGNGLRIGSINMAVNIVLYGIMLFLFDWHVVIYSAIYAFACATTLDHMYSQNINTEVHIITKKDSHELEKLLMNALGRGVTRMSAVGAYSEENEHILYMIVSKYELRMLKEIVTSYDNNAFIVAGSGVNVTGNFAKHLK